jgi:glucose-1-phosphate cytidylyltransferase
MSRREGDEMKVMILAGGLGSRLAEETTIRPKPMVEIGGLPILWHIMSHYASFGHDEFVVALGYKGEEVKRYFADRCSLIGDLAIDLGAGNVESRGGRRPDWNVELIETGADTQTGGRIKRLQSYSGGGTFMLTWGDGVSDIDITKLIEFHKKHGKLCTMTAVRPPARFGHMEMDGDAIVEFSEKPQTGEGWINGAFFVCEPEIFDYIDGDTTAWEREPLERLAKDGQLMAYRHESFWQCMDTLRDKQHLQALWDSGQAPWKVWN